jgi:hypothetical protein
MQILQSESNIMWSGFSVTDRWFSPNTPVSSTNKTDRHDITEILLKVALNTINPFFNVYNIQTGIVYNYRYKIQNYIKIRMIDDYLLTLKILTVIMNVNGG